MALTGHTLAQAGKAVLNLFSVALQMSIQNIPFSLITILEVYNLISIF